MSQSTPHKGGSIEVIANAEDDHIHVLIRDEGIPPQALEKVFDPYNRVHTENTRYIKGTGLGLPIVRQIIELHHGKVWVESVLGKGSIFHFTLPLTAVKQPVTAQAGTQTTPYPLE
jgi:signal transduction histidine kinase